MEDAKKAGVVKDKSGWDKYPANMLRWRAVGYCADVVFPDVIGGMYRPEELGADVNAEGEPLIEVSKPESAPQNTESATIEAEVVEVEESEPEDDAPKTVSDLFALGYNANTIMSVNDNKIPATEADVADVFEKLRETADA
jgi:hypothetical protein